MNEVKQLAYDNAADFREKYGLGNYCANQLIRILEVLEANEGVKIKLIRTPFTSINLSGLIGYKHGNFIIVTNTNHTLGSERFTIAHEIYHLLNSKVYIKESTVIGEDNISTSIREVMANAFAAELLMPQKDVIKEYNRLTVARNKSIDESVIITLQQTYGVGYLAITKRLLEIGLINSKEEEEFNQLVRDGEKLNELTIKLGYTNELNIPSKVTMLLQKDLEVLKDNYDNGSVSYDELVRIFNYLGCEPERFGYEYSQQITTEAIDFMKSLDI